jgi:hypothetical protein
MNLEERLSLALHNTHDAARPSPDLADRIVDRARAGSQRKTRLGAPADLGSWITNRSLLRYAAVAVVAVLAVGAVGLPLMLSGRPATSTGSALAPGTDRSTAPTASPSSRLSGTFTITGSMVTGRSAETATLLQDGRVLIAGGEGSSRSSALSSAELYDPKSGTFSATGSMKAARYSATATLLRDGLVLITDGVDPAGNVVTTAELYDSATGTFGQTASPPATFESQTVTLLQDGRVLMTGGTQEHGKAVTTAELYDPTTGAFSPTGSMTATRFGQTATLLSDGRVLITGGQAGFGFGPALTSAELYDPKTGTFSPTGQMPTARDGGTATALQDGRVLIAGGTDDNGNFLTAAELYDPTTGTFTLTGSLTITPSIYGPIYSQRVYTATLLQDGRVLIIDGLADSALPLAEVYDPKTGVFTPEGSTTATSVGTATLLSDGRVLVTTGEEGTWFPPAELYNP